MRSTFLNEARQGDASFVLKNARTDRTIASIVDFALTRATRNRGLLNRDSLDKSEALVIAPCFSIHTAFMKFAIDVVFVDRDGCAVKIVRDLPPWRIAGAMRAHAVIEMAGGSLQLRDVFVGDRFYLAPFGTPRIKLSEMTFPEPATSR